MLAGLAGQTPACYDDRIDALGGRLQGAGRAVRQHCRRRLAGPERSAVRTQRRQNAGIGPTDGAEQTREIGITIERRVLRTLALQLLKTSR